MASAVYNRLSGLSVKRMMCGVVPGVVPAVVHRISRVASREQRKVPRIQAATPKQEGGRWIWYLGLGEKLPDQVLVAAHTSGHDSMGRDAGQVALLILVYWLPGVVLAEELILVPVSLEWKVLWGRKAQRSQQTVGRDISCGPPFSLKHKPLDLVEITF